MLIFDQFEEILTLDPADRDSQEVFFQELGSVLADGDIWALFSMREDYIGGLDRFLRYLPSYLQTTYRLDFLESDAAKIAIQEPAGDQGVIFRDEAADRLLRRLTHGAGPTSRPRPRRDPSTIRRPLPASGRVPETLDVPG